jgi:valyl-tRNA synthetase
MSDLDKAFNPADFEPRVDACWSGGAIFRARPESAAPRFSMVIPPPNVTGRLHMGHALNNTLQDILARWHRMRGADVLWLPGTDHAGIATQMVLERELAKEGITREGLGRDAFVRRVWKWKEEYGGAIATQLRRLGASCDWSRERFTLDPGLSRAVREVFVRLYEEGLIYRDKFIVNWCPGCRTAISDLEVIPQEMQGRLTTLAYPFADGDGAIQVATTRPETMLGDTGVAVHPEDPRYRAFIGRRVILPLVGREIPIVADPFVDPQFGTGAVKVTPAHDPNDFAAAQRTGLPSIVVMDGQGRMNDAVPAPYRGLDRFVARERVLADLQAAGAIVAARDHAHNVGRCQRCQTVIEPFLSTQWFVRVKPLAGPALQAVADGRVRFTPAHWVNSYNEWMENIHDWCISRQLWWGHQIPAWHCGACAHITVARDIPRVCGGCGGQALRQDPDVLDTWFSSALWPFSTLGWPEATPDLRLYYPTTILVTAFDILFFWVARMIMMGLKFMGEVPFREVYIHGIVRDAQGQKMSKTRGNVVDPLEVIDRHGTDALRFTMAAMATPGSDLPLAEERLSGYRAFANKIWNATRFVVLNLGEGAASQSPPPLPPRADLTIPDRWILSRLQRLAGATETAIAACRFDEAANALYGFLWHEYCDWYLEMAKPSLAPSAPAADRDRTRAVLVWVLDRVLHLMHPFMPFLTEELWSRIPRSGGILATSALPAGDPALEDDAAEADMAVVMDVVGRVRNIRAELNIDPGRRLPLLYDARDARTARTLAESAAILASLARLERLEASVDPGRHGAAARAVAAGVDLAVPLAGVLDLEAERRRLQREIDRIAREQEGHARKLDNPDFLGRARPEAVEKTRRAHAELAEKLERLGRTLASIA